MSQEDALASLQSHPLFKPGSRIASIKRRGPRWVAEILQPKTAGPFPPKDDSGDSGEESEAPKPAFADDGSDDGPDDSSSDDAPSGDESSDPLGLGDESGPPKEEGDKKPGGDVESQILHTLQEILHALHGGPTEEGLGGPDALAPGPGGMSAPPPPKGGPPMPGGAGAGAKGPGGARLKPGEVRNTPGVTPVGAPSFSHTTSGNGGSVTFQSTIPGAAPTTPSIGAPTTGAPPTATCPQCGGTHAPGACPAQAGGPAGAGGVPPTLSTKIASIAGKLPTIILRTSDKLSVKEAVAHVREAAEPHGYKVRKVKRENGYIRVMATVR